MTNPVSPEQAGLLEIFEAAYGKIASQGYPHRSIQGAKCLSDIVAIQKDQTRELALLGLGGAVQSFALVNGKGYVETLGGMTDEDMANKLRKTGDRVARVVPSHDAGMYHYGTLGARKVL